MKKVFKAAALALAISTLAGCAVTPPTPPAQLSDIDLCAETGRAYAHGNTSRLGALMAEGESRAKRHAFTIDEATCKSMAEAGINRAQNEIAQQRQDAANWQNAAAGLSAAGNQILQQQQQQQIQQQQALNQATMQAQQFQQNWQQQQQMQQQTQALQSIDRTLRGY